MADGRDPSGVLLPVPRAVAELVSELGGEADPGVAGVIVARVVEPEGATRSDDLALVLSADRVPAALACPAVLLVARSVAARIPPGRLWVHDHALWALSGLLAPLVERPAPGVAGLATVDPGASVDPSATVRAGAILLAGARIGPESVIGERAVVYGGVTIGARVVVGPGAILGRPGFGFTTGPAGEVVRVPQLGGVVIEDDVEIGALSTVDSGTLSPTLIERGVKLDAQVHVGHNVRVGGFTMVAAQSGFAGSTEIGRGVLVGGQVGVADHLSIGDGARIAAGSGVISDVPAGMTVAGYPAVRKSSWLRIWARLLGDKRGGR